MKDSLNKSLTNHKSLKSFIKIQILKTAKKLKGKYNPISELVDNIPRTLKIRKIYRIEESLKNLFLIIVNNYSKQPKVRYFLALMLASQSSDFLVSLAKDYATKNNLKLIQYSLFPKNIRISLLTITEIQIVEEFSNSIELLKNFRNYFRKTLEKIKNLV
ncbi:MAG: hypothetical protein ACFFAH_02420 [Promethearchaeota archaeon]